MKELGIQGAVVYFTKSLLGLATKSSWLRIREVEEAVLEGSVWPSGYDVGRILKSWVAGLHDDL